MTRSHHHRHRDRLEPARADLVGPVAVAVAPAPDHQAEHRDHDYGQPEKAAGNTCRSHHAFFHECERLVPLAGPSQAPGYTPGLPSSQSSPMPDWLPGIVRRTDERAVAVCVRVSRVEPAGVRRRIARPNGAPRGGSGGDHRDAIGVHGTFAHRGRPPRRHHPYRTSRRCPRRFRRHRIQWARDCYPARRHRDSCLPCLRCLQSRAGELPQRDEQNRSEAKVVHYGFLGATDPGPTAGTNQWSISAPGLPCPSADFTTHAAGDQPASPAMPPQQRKPTSRAKDARVSVSSLTHLRALLCDS